MSKDIINVLMLGDIIGKPGMEQIYIKLSELKKKENIHFAIANGENSDNGFGITQELISSFKECGIDVITSGNHIWSNNDADNLLERYDYLLRPANYPSAKGKGWWTSNINNIPIGVVNIIGRYFMTPIDCPFRALKKLLTNELKKCTIIIVDFHAEYNAEKLAFAYNFDGKVSLIAGTHTHTQTADEKILPKGTGYITDLGMCGGIDSIIGMKKEDILKRLKNQIVIPFVPSSENPKLQGIIAKINVQSKKTENIKRFSI